MDDRDRAMLQDMADLRARNEALVAELAEIRRRYHDDVREAVAIEVGCTRSHPHELMGPVCELRTDLVRSEARVKQMEDVVEAAEKYLSECLPHPCPDLALRLSYRDVLRKALAKAKGEGG